MNIGFRAFLWHLSGLHNSLWYAICSPSRATECSNIVILLISLAILRVYPLRLLAHAEIPDMFFLLAPVANEGAIRETQARYASLKEF
jgi:hypothetical protein